MSGEHEETVATVDMPNALGHERTVVIKRNEWGNYSWRVVYPAIVDREFTYTHNWFSSEAAARRSARRFMKTLAQ